MRACIKCGESKADDLFVVHSSGRRANRCKPCASAYLARYRAAQATPESRAAFLADAAARKAAKAEASAVRKRAFRADYEKRPHVVAYRTTYKTTPTRRKRTAELAKRPEKRAHRAAKARVLRATDPKFLINSRMSCMLRRGIRGGKAGRSWKAMVDYTVDELREHIERQFLPRMGWHNAAKWHIDHIIPIASFDFTSPDDEAFRRCWALANLRPLWGADNIKKSDRVETLL